MTTNIEQYTLINGHTERQVLPLAFEAMGPALKIKASFGRTLYNGKGPRAWVDAKPVHHSFDDAYQGGWMESPNLTYNLYIEVAEVDPTVVAEFLKGYGLKAEAHGTSDVKVGPHMYSVQRSRLEEWAKAKDAVEVIRETRAAIRDNAQFLASNWDIATSYLGRDGNHTEVGGTTRRLSDLSNTLWYAEQTASHTYLTVYPENFGYSEDEYAKAKYDAFKLASMTAEEVIAL